MRRSGDAFDASDHPTRQRTAERRTHRRAPEAMRAVLRDGRGREIGRGKTVNISEGGVYVVLPATRGLPPAGGRVHVELSPPAACGGRATRNVRYVAAILRGDPMGQWTGVALEFVEKLA